MLEVFSGSCLPNEINQGSSSDGCAGGKALDLALDLVVVGVPYDGAAKVVGLEPLQLWLQIRGGQLEFGCFVGMDVHHQGGPVLG